MNRQYINQGSGGTAYSTLQVSDERVEKEEQLSFMIFGEPGRSVVLDAEQIEDLRQYLNERAISKASGPVQQKVIVKP